jgi:hemerythrin superfamily protein
MAEKPRKALDALDLLMQDHREVESLFRELESLKEDDADEAGQIIETVSMELTIHDRLETEIFYPAIRGAAASEEIEDLLEDAEADHETVRDLIEKLDDMDEDDEKRDAYFTDLSENVKHHVETEEAELFPKLKELKGLDLVAVGAEMQKRKVELMAEMGLAEEGEAAA